MNPIAWIINPNATFILLPVANIPTAFFTPYKRVKADPNFFYKSKDIPYVLQS